VLAVMDTGAADETRELALRVHLLENTEAAATAPDGFADALRAGSVLRLQYRDREGAETEREVEPLGYVGRDGSWYLVAWCRTRNGIRAFRGDRILSVERTGERPPRRPLSADDLQVAYGELRPAYREE